jgi:hypothetical protein
MKATSPDALVQALSIKKLHDDKRHTALQPDIVEGNDVGMGKRRDGSSLALESGECVRVARQTFGDDLDGNLSV